MTDHKFTDEEVIKALECCVNNDSCKECPISPNYGNYGYCTNLALTHALALINRQKAELEQLQNVNTNTKADADLVRCRDCEHVYNNNSLLTFRCMRSHQIMRPDDFCSFGKRKGKT